MSLKCHVLKHSNFVTSETKKEIIDIKIKDESPYEIEKNTL